MCVATTGLVGCGYLGIELLDKPPAPRVEDAGVAGVMVGGDMATGGYEGAGGTTGGDITSSGGDITSSGGDITASGGDITADSGVACDTTCDPSLYLQVASLTCDVDQCVLDQCAGGFDDCDGVINNGCEVDLSQPSSCGGCGMGCDASNAVAGCGLGSCSVAGCDSGYDDCDGLFSNGCETPLNTLTDCGACGATCSAAQGITDCSTGSCTLTGCNAGFDDCDGLFSNGCETPLNTLTDCGACNAVCSVGSGTPSCGGGVCTNAGCVNPDADCDSDPLTCETNLHTLLNCGACNAACGPLPNATATCSTGSCEISACNGGYDDCDSTASNGCETDLSTNANCGSCSNACLGSAQCVGDTCTGFRYTPSNFDPGLVDPSTAQDSVFNCGTTIFDSTTLAFTNGCGTNLPTPFVSSQTTGGGLQIVILPFLNLTVASSSTLQLVGNKPVVLAALGDVTITGTVNASANSTTPGAGGDQSCGTSQGNVGTGSSSTGAGGGGGGGFGTNGGGGGTGDGSAGGSGGVARGSSNLSPLLAGCRGGYGGACSNNRGSGGGAVQISAAGMLQVTGTVRANGSNGTNGCDSEGGGSGGGSGGGILLEADNLQLSGTVTANGGNGGSGAGGGNGGAGGTGSVTASGGQDHNANGGGGGGGAVGRARFRGIANCSIGGSVSASTSTSCP